MKTLSALTTSEPTYPGYVSVCEANGNVHITVRSPPAEYTGVAVCGQDCVPGSSLCNNYCNLDPLKGPMKDRPKSIQRVRCGDTTSVILSKEEWQAFSQQLKDSNET
jgi:hypothetical protein